MSAKCRAWSRFGRDVTPRTLPKVAFYAGWDAAHKYYFPASAHSERCGEAYIVAERQRFESWISAPPFERPVSRWPDDPSKYAWPGAYVDIDVELAWEAWKEAVGIR